MKYLTYSLLVISFALISCKKEPQTNFVNSDSVTVPDTVHEIPISAPVDTLVAAPKNDSTTTKIDSAIMTR